MPPKINPLKLNALQLKTLTILQVLATLPEAADADAETGEVTIKAFPDPHGDHFHLGEATVSGADMTGLFMQTVWNALERKGLERAEWPARITLTKDALSYETGLADAILHRGHH